MEHLQGTDLVARMASREGTETLQAELSKSLSRPRRPPATSQNLVCDQILRACVQRLGELGGEPEEEPRGELGSEAGGRLDHATSLLGLAEVAVRGYVASAPRLSSPFYLEKILYHLLRNAAAGGCSIARLRAAQLLLVRLRSLEPIGTPCKDFISIAQNAFLVLWKRADGPGQRLQALHFLLLLENEEAAVLPLEPPFFTSRTARQAAATILSEARRTPISVSWVQCTATSLRTLRQEAPRSPGLPQAFCCFELALEQCRQLCRAGCYSEAEAAAEDAHCFLRGSRVPLDEPLNLLEAAVRLNRVLAEGSRPAGPHLSQAAAVLGGAAEASERLLRLLAEGCQLVVVALGEHNERSPRQPLSREDVLGLCAFVEGHCQVLGLLLQRVPPDGTRQRLALKQLFFHSLQLFTSMACDTFKCSQAAGWSELERLTSGCRGTVARMLEALEGLPDTEQAEHLDATASCTFKLAYIFYNQNLHEEASSISELFCRMLETTDSYKYPEIPHDKLHRCFRLQVESYRKLGRLESALASTVQWLVALRGRLGELLAEPVSLWARVKTDAVKHGAEELRLRTLKEALEGRCLDAETLVAVLLEELKAYKTIPANTGQERYSVLCDLLEICSEESGRLHERAFVLTELARVLCYHKSTWQTDCSALDSVHEALRLLEAVPRSAQNQKQLLDDRAQALLWLYICTLESKLEEGTAREQRAKAQGQKNLDDFKPNDLDYEAGPQETFLYEGISFNLATESDACPCPDAAAEPRGVPSACSEHLDEALALWKELLVSEGVPAVRSPKQTMASLHIMASLYRLMAKPLQAIESYLLVRALCGALGDSLGMAGALCQVTKLLLQLECHSYAELFLAETESCLQKANSSSDSYLLLQQTCLMLRSQMCCASNRIEEGLALLLEVLQNPALQKVAKVWHMLRAQVLQLTALYLSLPPSRLSPELRQRISAQGPKTPEAALAEAYKLFRSIFLLLAGSDMLGAQKPAAEAQFMDCGNNVLQKWQTLAELLSCMECLVALLGRAEVVCRAKAFCLEGIRLATRLQASRWCISFLVLKLQLELQQDDLELSHVDLQQALFLLESGTEFDTAKKQRGPKKILPRKGRLEGRRRQDSSSESSGEDEAFLKGPALEFVAGVSRQEKAAALCSSPQLKTKLRRRLDFLAHPAACPCCLCSDLALSALCLRWLLACAQGELAAGSTAEGLGLLQATLRHCGPVAARFSTLLQDKLGSGRDAPALELLDDLVATGYATLALHSLASPQPERELLEQLEAGLSFVASCRPHLPSLEVSRASLLLVKAIVTICHLATKRSGSVASILPAACAWEPLPPSPTKKKAQPRRGSSQVVPAASSLPKPKATKTLRAKLPAGVDATQAPVLSDSKAEPAVAPRTLRPRACPPTRARAQGGAASPVPRPRAKNQRAKPLAAAGATNTCALGNSDAEVSPVVLQPEAVPSSLHQVCTPTKARGQGAVAALPSKAPFTAFKDASPPLSETQLLMAPKIQRSRRFMRQVTFSDDSNAEDPKPGTTPASGRSQAPSHRSLQSASHCRRLLLPEFLGTEGCQLSSSEGSSSSAQPRRGHTAAGTEEKRQQATRRAPARRAKEEQELLRTIKEDKENIELDNSFKLSQACEEEEGAAGSIQPPRRRQEIADGKHKVLQREATKHVLAGGRPGSENPLCLDALHVALPLPDDSLLDTACGYLKDAFNCISHCPPAGLYSQICQLLALLTGDQDPVSTAYLLSESVSITTRHQLLSIIHKKLHKLKKKSAAAAAEQLQGLSLQDAPSRIHHLTELQNLFSFSPTGLGPQELNRFREQLQQIPAGVTVCLLTLVSVQPFSKDDMLLLTRLERGSTPITIHIPTALTKAPLSSVLSDFDTIQKEQKETINCTDNRDWWLWRSKLDRRMKSLIDTLETEVLGCWKGMLLPTSQEPALAKEAARLFAQLRPCGWRGSDPALLKVLLNAAPLLTPADVRALAAGMCPSQSCNKAELLLQKALEKQRSRVRAPGGSLVLVLDKHLQKLPWESMACLRAVPVTRLPSLRFLLSYNLAPRQAGSVLRRGVNPTRTFYILNPQNNLPSTEERFRSWFESQQGWSGVTGAIPSQEQMQAALLEHDLYIYVGHGAGARLLDGTDIAQLDCNAVALLFGCSSAALAVRGGLEGSGIILKYLLAGCPLILGNLWDVTDRDLDRYTEALLQGWLQAGSGAPLLHYVAQARQAPRLKYLIGAAPVAYGLPVCLQ
ncbi:separin [Aythya fuligula]|uniref:separase n=1 Tax=Aythya fuligula TaxID=219594 RepID=A0A6J3EMT3_AYTFU|nr:separin [Aythya fuligula]